MVLKMGPLAGSTVDVGYRPQRTVVIRHRQFTKDSNMCVMCWSFWDATIFFNKFMLPKTKILEHRKIFGQDIL